MKRKRLSALYRTEQRYGYLMISPVVLGFCVLLVFPLLYELYMSLTDMQLNGVGDFVGLQNYVNLFNDPKYINSMKNTVVFAIGVVPVNVLLAIIFARMLHQQIRGVGLYRTIMFLPYITPVVVWAQVWKLILAGDTGILNNFLSMFGIEGTNWLFDMEMTMPMVIANVVLKGVGYNVVIFLSAMMSVPESYYEAAELDGAGKLKQIWHITLPCILPSIITLTLLSIGKIFYSDFGLFYQVPRDSGMLYSTTNVIDTYVYRGLMKQGNIGMSSAAGVYQSVVGFVLVLLSNLVVRKVSKENALF